jgi:hypothetical protein
MEFTLAVGHHFFAQGFASAAAAIVHEAGAAGRNMGEQIAGFGAGVAIVDQQAKKDRFGPVRGLIEADGE